MLMSLSLSGCPEVGRWLSTRRASNASDALSRSGLVVLQEHLEAGPLARLLSWRGLRAWEWTPNLLDFKVDFNIMVAPSGDYLAPPLIMVAPSGDYLAPPLIGRFFGS